MRIVNTKELKKNAEKLLSNVINNDEFFEIETKDGIAVVINEREWKILIDSLGGRNKRRVAKHDYSLNHLL